MINAVMSSTTKCLWATKSEKVLIAPISNAELHTQFRRAAIWAFIKKKKKKKAGKIL